VTLSAGMTAMTRSTPDSSPSSVTMISGEPWASRTSTCTPRPASISAPARIARVASLAWAM
jgi:hypothetical protein